MSLDIRIWNVNHGNSMSIKLPNGNIMMIDCGSNPTTNFSPILQTRMLWGDNLGWLIISHPHMDHIRDIVNIDYLKPTVLTRPKIDYSILRKDKYGSDLNVINSYIGFQHNYSAPSQLPNAPNQIWRDEVEIENYSLNGEHSNLNDYSMVTFISYGSFHFASGGDLSTSGWERLVEQEGRPFVEKLSKVNFFHASHHGRREGFNPNIMRLMNPYLVFVSDKEFQDTSVTDRYREFSQGWNVVNEITGEETRRKVLTTRSDGRLKIKVDCGPRTTVGVYTR